MLNGIGKPCNGKLLKYDDTTNLFLGGSSQRKQRIYITLGCFINIFLRTTGKLMYICGPTCRV